MRCGPRHQVGRMKRSLFLLLLGLSFASSVGAKEPIVVWLSFDGVRHDALDPLAYPALGRLQNQGARATSLRPVFPSSTFANHVAMATGTHADRHGIVGNRFLDPELGFFDYGNDAKFLEAEPIWISAERQGVKAATFFWVCSETDWQGTGQSYRRAPFDGGLGEAEKVDQILSWLDLPEAERPRLIMSWWHGADAAGHRHGPGSDQVKAQLRGQDLELSRLLAGIDQRELWPRLTLMVVSDHGMTPANTLVDAGSLLDDADVGNRVVHGTSVAHVHLKDTADTQAAVAALQQVPGIRAFPSQELPESLRYRHPTRTGQVVAMVDPPLRLGGTRSKGLEFLRKLSGGGDGGAHGYDPDRFPDMHGVLLAMGRGVPAGISLPPTRVIDLAATVSQLLAIEPPRHSEGAPISGLGTGLAPPTP